MSLTTGVHPDLLKIAKTIPIFKKSSKLNTSNYRPISLLSNLNKILENLCLTVYTSFSTNTNVYMKHSTNQALIKTKQKPYGRLWMTTMLVEYS